jgi:hypothetical protein
MIKIEKEEWFFIFLIWLILTFLIFFPFLVGKIMEPKDSIFLGFQEYKHYRYSILLLTYRTSKRWTFLIQV